MRTYEVTMQVVSYHTVTVNTEERAGYYELERLALQKLEEQGVAGNATHWLSKDVTPKEPTDKDRFNDAFRALRKMGYAAKQNQSRDLPEYPERHVMTMKDDVDAFCTAGSGEFIGMMPLHWDSDTIEDIREIRDVFLVRGFDVKWGGSFWDCIEIRKGNA